MYLSLKGVVFQFPDERQMTARNLFLCFVVNEIEPVCIYVILGSDLCYILKSLTDQIRKLNEFTLGNDKWLRFAPYTIRLRILSMFVMLAFKVPQK